ncbi:MAG: TIGR00282 family metallophosphoesterase [Gammaproteobacteria bacterium]|nr:TIGR00282 family metallophosphoesterase [Gammaproteobacteria bacterium]
MKILFVGDVVGKPGRRVLFANLDDLQTQHGFDLVIVNAENAAGGFGVTRKIVDEFLSRGVDVLTSGNHIWDKREALDFIDEEPRLLRPHNYPPGTPGSGWHVAHTEKGIPVGILNIMGTVFMQPTLGCPFRCADQLLQDSAEELPTVIVDFHAEATSEKVAMGWHLDGRVSAVLGSHTHVPTADERILPGGTAYISDVGMTGCYDSIIGMDTAGVLKRFVHKLPDRFAVAQGMGTLCGAIVTVDDASGRSIHIERVTVTEGGGQS